MGFMAPYSMTKAAMVSLVTVMRMDLAAYNINVSALCPGIIKTNVMKDGRLRGEHNTAGAIEFYETKGLDPAMVARLGGELQRLQTVREAKLRLPQAEQYQSPGRGVVVLPPPEGPIPPAAPTNPAMAELRSPVNPN